MHTSKVLQSSDFHYVRRAPHGSSDRAMESLYPDYQTSDRVGVVSPRVEDGLVSAGYALLALTTTFYDRLRASTTDFFDYPQHFALLGATAEGILNYGRPVAVDEMALEATWGNLDVWPDSQWLVAPVTATAMIKKVFDFQINRLFWPQSLVPQPGEERLPGYLRKMLGTRLKSVCYYNTVEPDLEIHVTQPVEAMVRASLARLPSPAGVLAAERAQREVARVDENEWRYRECYRDVSVQEFLGCLDTCFENR